jgi:Spy/CpxP family protein refolding chaperone
MRPFVTSVLVLACVFGLNISPAGTPLAFADEGCSGPGPMRSHPLPEMMPSRGMARPWVHGDRGHRARLVSVMLRWKDQLGLRLEQVGALRELRANFQRRAITRTAEIKLAALDFRGLREQDTLDLPKVEEQVRKIALLRADQHVARIRMIQASKAVLTPEQQETLKQLAEASRMGRRGMGMREPGMRPAPPTQ